MRYLLLRWEVLSVVMRWFVIPHYGLNMDLRLMPHNRNVYMNESYLPMLIRRGVETSYHAEKEDGRPLITSFACSFATGTENCPMSAIITTFCADKTIIWIRIVAFLNPLGHVTTDRSKSWLDTYVYGCLLRLLILLHVLACR